MPGNLAAALGHRHATYPHLGPTLSIAASEPGAFVACAQICFVMKMIVCGRLQVRSLASAGSTGG